MNNEETDALYRTALDTASSTLRFLFPDVRQLENKNTIFSPRLLQLFVSRASGFTADERKTFQEALVALDEWSVLSSPFLAPGEVPPEELTTAEKRMGVAAEQIKKIHERLVPPT